MQLLDIFNEQCIELDVNVSTKTQLFERMAERLVDLEVIENATEFIRALNVRESQSPTGIGEGYAIPHGLSETVIKPAVLYFRLSAPIQYESLDEGPVSHVFMLAIPNDLRSNQVKLLSDISTLLLDDSFRIVLNNAVSAKEILAAAEMEQEEAKVEMGSTGNKQKIVAVTSCATGIAHTFMAEKALYNAAKNMNIQLSVETQGAGGVENKLTAEQIAEADAVVLAIDKGIDESRFQGKQVLKVSSGRAIKEGEIVIQEALDHVGTYVKAGDPSEQTEVSKEKGTTKTFYQHMLNGVSYMIPIVVAGGILIALSFSFGINAFETEGSLPWALYQIGGTSAFALMFPVLAGFIAYDIADKPGFAPGIIVGLVASNTGSGFFGALIGGYLAGYLVLWINKKMPFPKSIIGLKTIVFIPVITTLIIGLITIFVVGRPIAYLQDIVMNFLSTLSDNNAGVVVLSLVFSVLYFDLGGPMSKMVYAFALAALAENIYGPMGAVMVIGMVPPIGMAIATLVQPKLFSLEEREAGKTALVLGLSYITEGAIPFLMSKPKSSVPSFMIGGFVGSLVAFSLKVEITAPHGGLFLALIPNAVSNVLFFILAILAGGTACAASMVVLTKVFSKGKEAI
ncbi:PTS fructose transporter subunit IIABC [Enterococcus avium]|uniref:PTS fructose transporter subunit IIABC n=1 Tax=Enterococcus avium TaxID=33945 RepID=UPI0032E3CC12